MKKVLVILGPTATGKTDVALELAKKYNGELVSADSRQVYKGLDIGTGKLPGKEVNVQKGNGFWIMDGIKVWMYDVLSPKSQYSVKDYIEKASQVVEDIIQREKLPIIVGGTGLYLKALLEGLPSLSIPINEKLRGELQNLSLRELQDRLKLLSLKRWQQLNESDRKNKRRLLRSIELIAMYGYMRSKKKSGALINKYNIFKVGLTTPREILNQQINARLISRMDQGMVKEAINLHKNGLTLKRMQELGLEYGMLAKLLNGEISEDQFINELSMKISQYAKRQMTWFKKEESVHWFNITKPLWRKKMEKVVSSWYYAESD